MGVHTTIAAALCAMTTLSACSSSRVLTLGIRKPRVVAGPTLVTDIIPTDAVEPKMNNVSNATLTGDMLEVFLSSNKKLYTAKRASPDVPFETPVELTALDLNVMVTSPAVSADGLTLWFASRIDQYHDFDIWMTKRHSLTDEWSPQVSCPDLNTPDDDLPRPPGNRGTILPLSVLSKDGMGQSYQIFFASRSSSACDFANRVPALELPHPPEGSATDPFLSEDGLLLFYSNHASDNAGDIVLAEHGAWGDPFGRPEPMDGVNTVDWKEGDPWLSPDGKTLYYTSHQSMNPDAGLVDDSGVVTNQASHIDRIYRVEFDVPWMP